MLTKLRVSNNNTQTEPSSTKPADSSRIGPRKPHQEITFEYPVQDLVPKDAELFLLKPNDIEYREKPNKNQFSSKGHMLEYQLIIDPDGPAPLYEAAQREVGRLVDTVDRLCESPGRTTLSVATFQVVEDISCKVEVQSYPQNGGLFRESFELDFDGIDEFLATRYRSWIRLLTDLVYRASDRAYLYVHSQLRHEFSEDTAEAEKERWSELWGSYTTRSAVMLFRRRLRDPDTGDIVRPDEHRAESFLVRVPCGHLLQTTAAEITGVSAEVANTATCVEEGCHKRILQEKDDDELSARRDLLQREEGEQRDEAWTELDGEDTSPVTRYMPVSLLPKVFEKACQSLDLPKTVMPKELSICHCEETQFAVRTLKLWAAEQNEVFCITLGELFRGLKQVVSNALNDTASPRVLVTPTPVGWWDFFDTALLRAINFLVDRGCNDDSEEHGGLHFHEDMLFFDCLEIETRTTRASRESDRPRRKRQRTKPTSANHDI